MQVVVGVVHASWNSSGFSVPILFNICNICIKDLTPLIHNKSIQSREIDEESISLSYHDNLEPGIRIWYSYFF